MILHTAFTRSHSARVKREPIDFTAIARDVILTCAKQRHAPPRNTTPRRSTPLLSLCRMMQIA
jgi:hypothetical protein